MDKSLTAFLAIYALTYFMVFTIARRDEIAVRGGILVFLIMISLFAPLKVTLFGFPSNISVIPSAALISCMAILAIERGFMYVMRIVLTATQWLIYMQIVIFIMTTIRPLTFIGDGEFNYIAIVLSNNTVHSFFATYVAAVIMTCGIAGVVDWCDCARFDKYVLAVIAGILFGGLAFFSLAFAGDPHWLQIYLISIPTTVFMGLLYYPILGQMPDSRDTQVSRIVEWERRRRSKE